MVQISREALRTNQQVHTNKPLAARPSGQPVAGLRKLVMTGKYPSIRIFESPVLERFTHVHPLVPLTLWAPIVVLLFVRAILRPEIRALELFGVGIAGILFWTLSEYLLHRYVFHLRFHGPRANRFQFLIHGLHHQDPVDPTRLVMPPLPGIILGAAFYLSFTALLGRTWGEPFFASFIIGYLCYDYIHFYVHHFQPKNRIGKFLKQSHMLHHYKDPESRWGVSSPLWDYVFGTLQTRAKK